MAENINPELSSLASSQEKNGINQSNRPESSKNDENNDISVNINRLVAEGINPRQILENIAYGNILMAGTPELEESQRGIDWQKQGVVEKTYSTENGANLTLVGVAHSNNPDSATNQKISTLYDEYRAQETDPSKRIVMVEGFHGGIPEGLIQRAKLSTDPEGDYKKIVQEMGEQAGVVFLAVRSGSEVVSPEVPQEQIIQRLIDEKISSDQISLYYFLREIPNIVDNPDQSQVRSLIAQNLYRVSEMVNPQSAADILSPEDAVRISKDEEFRDQKINEILTKLVPVFNKTMLDESNTELFSYGPDGSIQLNIDSDRSKQMASPYYNKEFENFFRIVQIDHNERDKFLLQSIQQASSQGKSPFVVFGNSHISAIEPAVDRIYTRQN